MGITFPLKHSVKTCALLVIAVLLLPLLTLAVSAEEASYTPFYENFEGTAVDAQKWAIQENTNLSGHAAYGGSIEVTGGQLCLSSNGSTFPWVNTLSSPFPTTGDFTVEFKVTYTCIGDWGDGVVVSYGPADDPRDPYKNRVFTLWAHDEGETKAVILIELFGKRVYGIDVPGFRPSTNAHLYRLAFNQGVYTVYVDNVAVASTQSQIRPNLIGLGHPPVYVLPNPPESVQRWSYWGWSSINIDYIKIETMESNDEAPRKTQISLSTNTETQEIGYRVDLSGNLTADERPVSGEYVILSYAIPGVSTWQPITSITTSSGGAYSASWIPNATGEFSLKAEYAGNAKYAGSYVVRNISVLESTSRDLFFVESNSSLSSLAFNSTSAEISLTVSGPSGTRGYVRFMVSKELIPDPTALKVFLDGSQLEFTVDSVGESWLLCFEFAHSTHTIVISMQQSPKADSSNLMTATIVSLALAAPIVFVVLFTKRRKKSS